MKAVRLAALVLALIACGGIVIIVRQKRAELEALRAASFSEQAPRPATVVPPDATGPRPPPAVAPATGTTAASPQSARNAEFERFTAQQRATLEKRYKPAMQKLGLSATEAEAFLNLQLNRLNISADLLASARQSGSTLAADPDGLAAAEIREKADIDAQIAALLGPDRFAQYQALDKDQRSQTAVLNVQKAFASSGLPLSADQAAALQEALTEKGTLQFGVRQVTDDVLVRAGSFLTPAQIEGLRQFQLKQQEVVRAKTLLRDQAAPH